MSASAGSTSLRANGRRWIRLAMAALAVAVLMASCAGVEADGSSQDEETGDLLPDLTLTSLSTDAAAKDLRLRENGRDRVLNLWAIWCAPCREELPVFDEVAQLTADVDVIGVNVGDTAEDAQSLVDQLGLTFPQVLDHRSKLRTELRIAGMPATIFVNSSGEVVWIQNGEVDRAELVELINEHFDAGLT